MYICSLWTKTHNLPSAFHCFQILNRLFRSIYCVSFGRQIIPAWPSVFVYSCSTQDFLSHSLEWEIFVLLNRLIFISWPHIHDPDLSYKPVMCQGSLSTDFISYCYQDKFRINLKFTINNLSSSTSKVSQHLLSLSSYIFKFADKMTFELYLTFFVL